jgi:hypothetical protein
MSTPNPTFPVASVGFKWTIPTTNVDGTPIVPGELTGFDIGVRADGTGAPGTYAAITNVPDPTATSEALSKLGTVLAPGNYWSAIRSDSAPGDGPWSSEVGFSIAAPPPPVPNPPSGFTAA